MSSSLRLRRNTVLLRFKLLSLTIAFCLLAALVPQSLIKFAPVAEAAGSPNLVISQVYGGGGNAGATLKNDFIEIFNRGTTTVNLAGWSVQYGSSGGTTWSVTTLSGSIAPGKYYLVQEAVGAGGTVNLPTPDATGSIAMSATAGKVALVNSTVALTGACPAAVDMVGFGTANCSEGTPTPTLANTTAAVRNSNGCTDTDNNAGDFTVVAPSPRNSASPANTCATSNTPPAINAFSNPIATVAQGAPTFTVSLSGSDDNNIFNWSATPGAGVTSVSVTGGQGTANVTYSVTLSPSFSGTAIFTASLSDNVNAAVTSPVNIAVTPTVVNDLPIINAFANPIATVAQDAAPFTVSLSGSDDNNVFNWSAAAGAGISSAIVTGGQGTANATYTVTLQAGYSGTATLTAILSDNVNPNVTRPVNITVTPAPPPPLDHIVISQIYGGGGNTGATYQNDFVQLYNPTTVPFDTAGWTIQYGSATGTTWQTQPLGGVIQPGEYYLITLASGGAVGASVPAANISGDINMSGTAGKVALVNNGDALSGCPIGDPSLVDLVGYGTTANCREGGTNAPAPSNTTAIFRKSGGAIDTNVNGSDFVTGGPNPVRTSPITEIGPSLLSTDPRAGGTNAPRDASITVTFTEPVDVGGAWFNISCATTGLHNDATVAGSGRTYEITPNVNFLAGEVCTVTIFKDFVHDSDLDDSAPNTDTMPTDRTWSFTVATGTAPPYSPDVHLTMGNPSGAVADMQVPNNYLMMKPEFALSYNRDKGTPNWVSWHLSDEWVGSLTRNDTFRPDPAVPSEWYRVLDTDYFTSGFDRGHMTPNADRDKETSIPINQATFLMSNMVPQAPDNNQGPWADFENYLRTLLPANEIYIVSGPAGIGGTGSSGFANTIAGGKITVPASTWKVALVIPKGDNDISRVTAATRTIAVIMPNTQGIRTVDWTTYLTTVDAVEQLTGYDFFSNLPDAVENSIEAGINGVNPPGTEGQSVSTPEDTPALITLGAVSPVSNATFTYTVGTPSHGTLSGTAPNLTYTPAPDFSGNDSFTFSVSDGNKNSNTSTVSIAVTAVNDAPVLSNVPQSVPIDELAPYTFTATASDVEEQALTFSLSGAPDGASIDSTSGQFTWTPTEAQGGAGTPFVFLVNVSDGVATTGQEISITVSEVNQAPVLNHIEDQTVYLGSNLTFNASGSDADLPTQNLTYSLTGTVPAGATISSAGVFNWTPTPAQVGAIYTFNVRVTDDGSPNNYSEQAIHVGVAYTWTGALPPINSDGSSIFKLGRTIPVKFKLTGASAGISTDVAKLYIAKVSNNIVGTETEADATGGGTSGNTFRHDATGGQYIFNLSTAGLTPGTYQLRLDMGDGVSRIITFGLRN